MRRLSSEIWFRMDRFYPLPLMLDAYYKEGSNKSQAIVMAFKSIMTGKPELLLFLMWFSFSGFLKSSVVSATSLCTRQWSTIKYKENVAKNTMYLVMLLAVKRKLWAIFLPRGSSWSKHREAGLNLQGFWSLWAYAHDFQRHLLSKLIVVNENCCLCTCFTELYLFYWLLVVSFSI